MKLSLKVNNQNLTADLIKPAEIKTPLPALIFVHGWRSNRSGNSNRAEQISKLGFICLAIDLRGHGDSDGLIEEFSRADHIEDIKSAYKYLSNLPEVDENKIGIIGASYGGYLAAVSLNYLKFNKIVLRVPALYFDDNFNIPTDKLIKGDPKAFKTADLSPKNSLALKGLSNFQGEILIIESEKDKIIPHEVIRNYTAVIEYRRSLTYKIMKNTPHSLETNQQEKEYITIVTNWLTDREGLVVEV